MLTMVPKHDAASVALVKALPTLIVKETNDSATSLLVRTLPSHLSHLFVRNTPIPPDVTTVIAKEMNNTKPAMKRAFVSIVGAALWDLDNVSGPINDATKTFAKAISGALEACIKTVSANPLGATAGPLEGYVAVAILLGPLAASGIFGTFFYLIFISAVTSRCHVCDLRLTSMPALLYFYFEFF